jgi:carbon storage regulator
LTQKVRLTTAYRRKDPQMLVLTRKKQEAIVIGDGIVVTVVEIHGDRIRLGIEAPKNVPVHRGEVYHRIQQEMAKDGTGWINLPNPSSVEAH